MSRSNCCFLTCIQISQETGQVVLCSHLFQNFPQFVVIHTVKGFGVVNKAEIDVSLELSCFFDDPVDVGNLISGSSVFSKTSLSIWKFTFHVLLKSWIMKPKHPLFWPHSPFGRKEDKQLDSELWGSPLSSSLFQGVPLPFLLHRRLSALQFLNSPHQQKWKGSIAHVLRDSGLCILCPLFLIYFIESVSAIRQAGGQALYVSVSEHEEVSSTLDTRESLSRQRAEKAQVQRWKALRDYTA